MLCLTCISIEPARVPLSKCPNNEAEPSLVAFVVACGFNNTLFAMCWSIFQCDDEDEESLRRPSGGQRKDGFVINKRHHTQRVCLGGTGNDHTDGQTAGLSDVCETMFHLDIEVSCENPPKSRLKRLNSLVRCITREIESSRTGPDIKPSLK